MSETVTQDVVEEIEQADQTEEPILEPLIEEVSIDGMCGVY
jgi:mycofactocin precursor